MANNYLRYEDGGNGNNNGVSNSGVRDINSDGQLNLLDAYDILAYLKNNNDYNSSLDANGDGTVNLLDVYDVLAYLKKWY